MSEIKHHCVFDVVRKSELAETYYCKFCGKRIDKKIYPTNALQFSYADPESLI